ncbi:hypothetical protein GCWU000341_00654 [Oribacterium sp. oral taxon 078 str. F0262]|nr:hypothetical protein GCWU000341_00654 [Oribacterium sp. oral taxon 078 str. F0262]
MIEEGPERERDPRACQRGAGAERSKLPLMERRRQREAVCLREGKEEGRYGRKTDRSSLCE